MFLIEWIRNTFGNIRGIVSYVYMLGSSLFAIGLSLVVLFVRTTITNYINPSSNPELTEEKELEIKPGKHVKIYYGTQTGTAKVRICS